MKDLNSHSKEELIKLLNQKEEEIKAAEVRAEKEHVIAEQAQKVAEIKEQSHLKFAHGVILAKISRKLMETILHKSKTS